MNRRLSLFGLALAAVAALAGTALAVTTTSQGVTAGDLQAVFAYRGGFPNVSGAHLQITQGSQVVYSRPVTSKLCGQQCGPASPRRSIGIAALAPHARLDVILELFSGGANCCFVDQVFSYDPSHRTFVKTEHDFADVGAVIQPIGPHRRLEFRSRDGGFRYAFTDGADSGEPIQIWQFAHRAFADVTRSYPGLIRKDAAQWFRLFKGNLSNGVGLIAAWAADEELLGHDALVQSTLDSEAAHGNLRSGPAGGPTGRAFIAKLNRFLVKLGYKP